MTNNTMIRIHPSTRPLFNAVRAKNPMWTLQHVVHEAAKLLAIREGIDISNPFRKARENANAQYAAQA